MSILAIKFKQCDEDIKKYCVVKKLSSSCVEALWKCHYPLIMNPLCLNSNISECKKDWVIKKDNDDYYIFYHCNCKYLLKNLENHYKTILEPIKSPNIYYGLSLKKLEKSLIKPKTASTQELELERIIKFFDKRLEVGVGE